VGDGVGDVARHGPVEPDSYRDVLGIRTRCAYLPPALGARLAGKAAGDPGIGDDVLHDRAEWDGLRSSVREAQASYTMIELGACYGPWAVAGAVAARQRGIADIRLVAVEADATHVEWIKSHFRDNGIDARDHRIVHGVVGTYDGVARFPTLRDPRSEWTGEAIFAGRSRPAERMPQRYAEAGYVEVPCVSLPALMRGLPKVDLIHFDIQGSEEEVIASAIDAMNAQVRRIVVGTHGHDIERSLCRLMEHHRWALEIARPAVLRSSLRRVLRKPRLLFSEPGLLLFARPELHRDGTYVWRNPRLV
jgi:FkbM family methyltransferase